jgi:hypothetical protein
MHFDVMPVRSEFRGEGLAATRRREMAQRNWLLTALEPLNLEPSDVVLISDADEIPNPAVVRYIRETGLQDGQVVVFRQRLCYYNVNTTRGYVWNGTRAVRYADLLALSPHIVRYGIALPDEHYPKYALAERGGWHLSYFGGAERVQQKMTNFLHQELVNAQNTDAQTIASRIAAGGDVWGRPNEEFVIEQTFDVPPPMLADPARWSHFWREGMMNAEPEIATDSPELPS